MSSIVPVAVVRRPAFVLLLVVGVVGAVLPGAIAQPAPGSAAPFKAVGNEPGWTLDVGAGRLLLLTDGGKTRTVLPLPPVTKFEGGRRYETRNDSHALDVTILDRVCADSMTGMPRP